ncbi:FecR family protein [Shinella granuli]|uniref:FecR family protein n=1 Tax=Shinella granuli TaxID=323621 RepID=A0A4R2CVW8_SHIGR|nr:FecR domain-containing protein [Shinella granuli]TCN43519.1 FecR family protein [Shinella granuli]
MEKESRTGETSESEAAISTAAAEWFARLLDAPSAADHQRFRAWLLADERHGHAYCELERLWTGAGLAGEPGSTTGVSRRTVLKGAGLALIAAGTGLTALRLTRPFGDHATGTGETATVKLADGTRVELSPRTTFSIDFSETARRVRLQEGEIFVDVAADAARPFTIEAGDLRATALGTEYSVAIAPEETSVLVTKHAVEVSAGGRSLILDEGQSLSYSEGRLSEPGDADTQARLAWRRGQLVFLSTPFSKVVEDIGRWRQGKIVVMDRQLARQPVTLIVDVKRSDRILETMELGLPIRVVPLSPWLTLIYRR